MKHPWLSVLLALVASIASPQERTGSINGRVADSSANPLPGASIRIEPGAVSVGTNREGAFTASGLAAGTYRVEVSYVGFAAETREVTVAPGAPARADFQLRPAVNVKEEVTVTASRSRGEVEALNEQKSAMNILDVLPAEVITSLPNKNIADAIGRLPSVSLERDEGEGKYVQVRGLEPRYTNMTINGVHIPSSESFGRTLKLDAIPSDLVGTIELHKTLSPDQDGDAIGGSVNLVTKAAEDQPYFTIGAETGRADLQGGRYAYQVNGTFSRRFGSDKALGLVLGGTYDWNGRAINDIEPAPAVVPLPDGTPVSVFTGVDYRDYRYERSRFGAAGGLDYRVNPDSSLYLRGLFSEFHNFGHRWLTSVSVGNFLTPTLTDDSGGFSGNSQVRRPSEQTYSVAGGGKHLLRRMLLDYNVSYSHARQNSIDYSTVNVNGPSAAFQVDGSDGFLPKFTPLGGVNQLDAKQYSVDSFQNTNDKTAARAAAVALNAAFPYYAGGRAGEFKVGGKYRDEKKTNLAFSTFFNATGTPSFLVSQGLDPFTDPGYYSGIYPQGPNLSWDAARNFFNTNPGAFRENRNTEHLRNDPNNYDTREKIAAAYAMNTITLGRATLVAGVRVERTDANYDGFQVNLGPNRVWLSTQPTGGASKYTDALPSVSLRYAIEANTNVRAVYGWAVSRPDYQQLVPFQNVTDARKQLSAGNPDLKPTRGRSTDVLLEHFLGSIGVVSAGAFYKDLADPIYPGSVTIIHGGIFDGFTRVQPINGPGAKIYGGEVAWQQHLGFLPGLLSGLGINANYTYTDSKATFDPTTGRTGTARLQRTTPNEANFGLTYDRGPFSFRGAVTYNSATIYFYQFKDGADGGLTGPNGDTFLYPHTQIDAQASYTFKNGLRLIAYALNLNDAVFGFYNGSPQWNIQREFYGRTIAVGFKYNR